MATDDQERIELERLIKADTFEEWLTSFQDDDEPEGMSFEDLMALKYPLIDREYPFHE